MKILNYTALACIVLVPIAMFLPIYETWVSEFEIKEQIGMGIYQIHKNGENGFIVVHNGFGTFYAFISCFITLLLAVGIFFVPRENTIPIFAVIFYFFSLIFLGIGSINFGNPVSDKMLIGFYLMLLSQTVLIIFSFYKSHRLNESDKYVEY